MSHSVNFRVFQHTFFLPECSTFAQSKNLFWLFMLEWTKLSREFLRRLKIMLKFVFWRFLTRFLSMKKISDAKKTECSVFFCFEAILFTSTKNCYQLFSFENSKINSVNACLRWRRQRRRRRHKPSAYQKTLKLLPPLELCPIKNVVIIFRRSCKF